MKRKNKIKSDYSQIKKKLFARFVVIAGISFLFCLLLFLLFIDGRGANFIVSVLQHLFRMEYMDAQMFYFNWIGRYTDLFWIALIILIFLIALRIILSSFTKYFDIINQGITSITDPQAAIRMPPEMAATQYKLQDVKTQLQNRELEARIAEQRKNDLVMYLAHDIRTPLTSVIGYLNLLSEIQDLPLEKRTKYADIALEKSYRLEKMLNELFEMTRYNSREISLQKEPLDLYYMLLQIVDEMTPVFSANGNTAFLDADENLFIIADPDKLARVFSNLLKNAASYSFPGTQIQIAARKSETNVTLTFLNQGNHLSKQQLSAIFEKFYRLDESRTSQTGGAGLGLAIAKEIILLHGGSIIAESDGDQIRFQVTLPVE